MAIIGSGLEAAVMINKMESKDALATKGSLYVGTGKKTTVTKADKTTVSIPETVAFNPPDMDGGVMIRDNSTSTGWKVDKVKAENLDNDSLVQVCLNLIYPVGSIYMSVKNASPETFLGGTWVAWGSGRVPVGIDISDTDFNGVEKTGGKKTHVLTENEMPAHKHTGTESTSLGNTKPQLGAPATVSKETIIADFTRTTEEVVIYESAATTPANNTLTVEHGITAGGGQPHSILQPYITCYMWKRVS